MRKKIISSKRTQTIEYWVNCYRVACKVKIYTRNKVTDTHYSIYWETVKNAQSMGLLPTFIQQEIHHENIR